MSDSILDKEALAAEYVLGTLEAEQRRRVEEQLASDPELARYVAEWSRRLAPLAEGVEPVPPPERVWKRIQTTLGLPPETSDQHVAAVTTLTKKVSFWRWCTAGTGAIAAALIIYIGLVSPPPAVDTRYVAVLNEGSSAARWLVTVDIGERRMTIRPLADVAVSGRSLELWLLPRREAPPRSLGLLDPALPRTVPIAEAVTYTDYADAVLAVSLEPEGGSPTGLPTGPVVYQGPLLTITD